MECIKVEGLCKKLGGKSILSDLSFSVEKGEVALLLGRNGSGKSTLMNIVYGQQKADSGKVKLLGEDPQNPAFELLRQRVVMITDDCFFYDELSPMELGSIFGNVYERWNQEKYIDYLNNFDIDNKLQISLLSRGMKRKLQLAFALASEPEVILLDEPLGGIDAFSREEIIDGIIGSLAEKGITILMASNDIYEISGICEKVLVLGNEGKLLIDSDKEALSSNYRRLLIKTSGRKPSLPSHSSIISSSFMGDELEIILSDGKEETLKEILSKTEHQSHSIKSLSLSEIFKQVIKQTKL